MHQAWREENEATVDMSREIKVNRVEKILLAFFGGEGSVSINTYDPFYGSYIRFSYDGQRIEVKTSN